MGFESAETNLVISIRLRKVVTAAPRHGIFSRVSARRSGLKMAKGRVIICGEAPPWGKQPWDVTAGSCKRLAEAITINLRDNICQPEDLHKAFDLENLWEKSRPGDWFDPKREDNQDAVRRKLKEWQGRYVVLVNRVAQCLELAYHLPAGTIPFCELSLLELDGIKIKVGRIDHPSGNNTRFDRNKKQIGKFLLLTRKECSEGTIQSDKPSTPGRITSFLEQLLVHILRGLADALESRSRK